MNLDQLKNFQLPGKTQKITATPKIEKIEGNFEQLSFEEIEEFADAGVFMAERAGMKIRNLEGFKFKIRNRIQRAGARDRVAKADIADLENFRAAKVNMQPGRAAPQPERQNHKDALPRSKPTPAILQGLKDQLSRI